MEFAADAYRHGHCGTGSHGQYHPAWRVGEFGWLATGRELPDLSERAVPLLLLALGLWYLIRAVAWQHLRHRHVHDHIDGGTVRKHRSFSALLLSLGLAMFLSPCLEIETYFLSAGAKGWAAVWLVALIYNTSTLSGMLLMVMLGRRGLQQVNAHWPGAAVRRADRFEHNENLITGLTLVGLALVLFQSRG